jgi:hypothetical protein
MMLTSLFDALPLSVLALLSLAPAGYASAAASTSEGIRLPAALPDTLPSCPVPGPRRDPEPGHVHPARTPGRMEGGSAHGITLNTLDQATLEALVAESHRHGLKAVVHVSTVDDAVRAFEAGADGLVHIWVDRTPSTDLLGQMAERGMFVVPTLTVLESVRGVASGRDLLRDEALAGLLTPGARVHREMELLVGMGPSPLEALRSATSIPARAFHLEGRGMIASGSRADLVLVEGGAGGSSHALRITGELRTGAPFPWAGAMLFRGAQPMAPADLSTVSGLSFQARGEGPAFQLFVFTQGGGAVPTPQAFSVGEEWAEVFVPWSAFPGVDPWEITGIGISAGPAVGAFDLWVDGVILR